MTRPAWVCDGRELFAVIELHPEGWHVAIHRTGEALGTFPTRQMAVAFAKARRAHAPAAAVAGEREADAKRVETIHKHQRAEGRRIQNAKRAERHRANHPHAVPPTERRHAGEQDKQLLPRDKQPGR
jgi:hypothetical protein